MLFEASGSILLRIVLKEVFGNEFYGLLWLLL